MELARQQREAVAKMKAAPEGSEERSRHEAEAKRLAKEARRYASGLKAAEKVMQQTKGGAGQALAAGKMSAEVQRAMGLSDETTEKLKTFLKDHPQINSQTAATATAFQDMGILPPPR